MKTAMQELIDEMDSIKNKLWEEGLKDKSVMISDMIKKAVNKLEKEKQQIKNAYIIGFSDCHSSSAKDQDLYFKLLYNGKDI
jgi:metal-responsive CopG/Arc/MetJ family transcriptional regulator